MSEPEAHCDDRGSNRRLTRRHFLGGTALASGLLILRGNAFTYAANEKLDIALVGAGGRGGWFSRSMSGWRHNLMALCDVDESRAAEAYKLHPRAARYHDFRVMIDKLGDKLDAVIVATPDHTHAVASACALRAGLPTYCEKPLTYSVHESRTLGRLAAEMSVPTQLGNQGTASHAFHRAFRFIRGGALGPIRKVYAWNTGANGQHKPFVDKPPVPKGVEWDLWLGPAAHRPYHPGYLRGRWHPWADFGTGVLGNWACHTLNLPFYALRIGELWRDQEAKLTVTGEPSPFNGHTLPKLVRLTWHVPKRGDLPPVEIQWANGSREELERIGYRKTVEDRIGFRLDWSSADGDKAWKHWAGVLLVGEKGMLHANAHNTEMKLLPEKKFADAKVPGKPLSRRRGHEDEWFHAIQGGPKPTSNFTDHGGPLTEFVLLGNVLCRVANPLLAITYRPATGMIVDHPAAAALLSRSPREGWKL